MKAESQVNFRMPTELRDQLQQSAEVSGRTLTAEIVSRLTSSIAMSASDATWRSGAQFLQAAELAALFGERIDELQKKHGSEPIWSWPDHARGEYETLLVARKKLWDSREQLRRELLDSLASL
ncbi:Arc family DNA-binding protein [Luteibacter sp. dw_328]|uniref:Arc family DNA-binding protein n=1 Tax=Luteibacter sp. dw_328 TaxID=2719796 RepID=UPI001BD50C5B|nr:Arc family DNA-binding protein [Luteibacter sp. dw_328]